MRLYRRMCAMAMLVPLSYVHTGPLREWLKRKKQPKIEHHVTEKPPEKMSPSEWLKKFATYDDIQTFNTNSTILAQQIFLGIYPSGWLTDEIALSTRARDAEGMRKRYSEVIGTQNEDTVGWFRMINNTIFHVTHAATAQEENAKVQQVTERKQEWSKIKETMRNIRKFQGEKAYNNMKDLVSKYWGQQMHWLFADQRKAAITNDPDSFLARTTRAVEFFTGKDTYKNNFLQPLQSAKESTVTLFTRASRFLKDKQDFPKDYNDIQITPQRIADETDNLIQSVRNAASEDQIERMLQTVQSHKEQIEALTEYLRELDAQISRAISEMPQEWQSRSMLIAAYKAWLIVINLHRGAQRLQFGVRNEHYILDATRKKIQEEKKPAPPAQITNRDYSEYLDYINPKSWWDYIMGN